MRRTFLLMTFLLAIIGFCGTDLNAQVAKVGNTEYKTIDDAIANWTNNTTLTLLSDVTLTDVIKLSSTEKHVLDLSNFTMTAASNKDAIQIENNGRSSASYALDIKADATNPGGITATGKAVVRTAGKSGVKDCPIIRFYNGVFNGLYVVYHTGSNGTNCPQFQFHGGQFNGTIYTNRTLNQFYGGVFNGSLQMSVDSSAYTLIAGGTFKQLSNLYMSALNSSKFIIGSAKGVYDKEVYIDDNGNYVIAADEPAQGIQADVAKTPGTNDYLAYSKVADEGQLGYTDVYTALNKNTSATVTVYVEELDLEDSNFNGTIVVPAESKLTITNAPATLVVKDTEDNVLTPNANGSYTTVEPQGNDFTGYTRTDAIWGETWGNATESFVIKVLDANDNVMGTTSLNNIGGIIDGDLTVTWSLKLDAASNTDEYWTMEWTTAPNINNMPAKVELWVDGVKVSGGDVVLNGPDNLNVIYAAVTDADGKIYSYHTSISNAIDAIIGKRSITPNVIALLRNTNEEVTLPAGVALNKNGYTADNVTIPVATINANTYASLAEAISNANDGDEIILLDDVTDVNVTINKKVTLNLNEKTIFDAYIKIASDVTVKNGFIKNVNESYPLVVNSGTLTVEGVAIEASKSDRAIWLNNSGTTLNFNEGSSILATKGESNTKSKIYGVWVSQGATANINGGSITVDAGNNATAVAIFGNYVNTVNVNGGKISTSGNTYSYAIWTEGNITVAGGEIITNENKYGYSSGITYGKNYAINTKGNVEISGGKFTTYGPSGYIVNAGGSNQEVKISGGEFTNVLSEADKTAGGHSEPNLFYGSSVSATITNGDFKGYSATLIKGTNSTLTVSGGTFDRKINDEYLAEGFELKENENGTYGVEENPTYGKVAKVGETYYTDLQEAIVAAAPSGTVEIINDVTVDKWIMFSERLGIGSGQIITIDKIDGLTINGNNHSLTINSIESASNGNRLFYDATELNIKDLTINYAEGVVGGIGLTSGTINNVTFNGGVGVLPGTGEITISGCTFNTSGSAIYNETDRDNLVVTGNTFNTAEGQYAIYLRGNTTFTDNIVKVGKVNVTNSGTGLISGNDFGTERFKVYNAATATIENNKINNLVFNDESEVTSTFGINTLSKEAQAVLDAAISYVTLEYFVQEVIEGNGTYDGNNITVKVVPASGDTRTDSDVNIPSRLQKYSNPEVYYAQYQRFGDLTDVNVSNVNFVFVPKAVTVVDAWNTSGATTTAENINGELQLMNNGSVSFTNCSFEKMSVSPISAATLSVTSCKFNGLNAYAIKDVKANTTITGTTFTDCNGGFWFSNAPANITVKDNIFTGVGRRGAIQFSATGDYKNTEMDITGNKVTDEAAFLWQLNETVSNAQLSAILNNNEYTTAFVAGSIEPSLQGDGSEANPYLINNVDDLVLFRDMVNTYSSDGSNQFRGKFVKLTNDIDLEGINWTPIGTNTVGDHSAFLGTFYGEKADGTIPTISNLYINADGDHLGFFARVGNFGDEGCTPTIKNIKFNNVDVSSNTTNGHGGSYVAGVIANAGGNTVISNIEVTGDLYVVGYGYIGGIVGHGYPDIDNCHVRANDGSYIQSHYWCCGGIIGYAGEGGTPITNSSVSGVDIWAKSGGAAAIAGLLQNGNKIENVSASDVEITSNSDYCMGYIAGNGEESILTEISIENVTATANGKPITATDAVAQIEDNIYFSLQDALNAGGNITVLRDVNITETVKVAADKEVTLDLNGKTIDGTEKVRIAIMSYGNLTVKDSTEEQLGTIKAGIGTAGNAINICAGTFTLESGNIYSKNNAILIDEQAAIVNIVGGNITAEPTTNNSAVFYISSTSETTVNIESGEMTGYNGVLLWNNTTLNITGGTINATGNTAIQGNGMYDNTVINISGENTSISGYYAAIYHPQGGELNISDGILSGWSGVVVKGGNVNISGGTINGTGEANDYRPVSSGYVDTGDALYVEHFDNSTNSGNYGTPTVTVTGGTFNSTNAKPIASYANSNNAANGVEALVNFVSGGTFSGEIEQNLLAEGFELVQNEDRTYGVVEALLKGKGTEKDPYLIENLEDLIAFRNSVNAGETKFNAPGVWVALADDIDMAGTNWTDGIGDGINATFDGCFDGKNYTIKNFTMEAYADSDGYVCGGLFGYIYGKNGAVVIRNLVMENVTITCDAERTGNVNNEPHNIGALVGFAMRCENSIINNIIVKGDITIDAQNVDGVGAIVGYSHTAATKITNCKVVANDGSYIKGHSFVGGITGYSYSNATITDCTVENIDIIGTSYSVGGIAGIVLANNVIKNCTVSENVEVNGQANVGYLVGAISSNGIVVNIENCSAKDPMIGGNYGDNQAVIARIENKYYSTLQAAFAAANNETVTLIADIELSEMITIPNGKTVTLDLNGKTITGTDTTSKNFSLIDNRGNLTITDSSEPSTGKMTLTATVNSGWNRYSAVIANNPGGKLTIENGTLEHLGGTDMAYGIDNLTNGKGTYAETVINGGYIKSTYRGVRQFLNGVEAQNILTVNGGTIEGANKSIWMQDPSKNANTGTLTVSENANLIGDVYLFVTAGSTEWPVEISIAAAALAEGSTVLTGNVPAGYDVQNINGTYGVVNVVAQIGDVKYQTLKEAVSSATDGATIQLIWAEGKAPIAMNADLYGKSITITGTATVDWNKNFLFVGRGGEGNATLTFDNANLTSASNSGSYGIHVSGREKNTNNKYDGTLIIKNSTIELDYLINKGAITLDNSAFTVKNGFSIGGRPASETESGEDATATITLNNGSKVIVNKHNGMGLGYEAIGVMNIDATSTFETTQAFLITANGTLNNAGIVNINGALTNKGTINFTDLGATLTTTTEDLNINDLIDNIEYKIVYEDETYKYIQMPSQEQSLVAGWNWYSTYLDITLNDLTTTLGDNGISIKNINGVNVENLGNNLWLGQLNEINPSEMYLIETTTECNLKLAADLLNPNEHQISLNAGWNWIGYPSNQEGVNINDALKDLNANPGDIIKSLNNGYAEYAFGQWLGTLNTMVPGVGYKYNNKSGEAKTFYYNIEATRGAVEANVTAENNYWTPNATKYPHNMTMTAVVDGLTNGNYEVAAFVNGEVRGSARPVYVEALDAHIFFLTIHGEDVEEMSFRLYDIDTDTEYALSDRINYSNDAHLGSVSKPYVFSRGTTGIGEAALSEINIYPNPTTTGSTIRLQNTCDRVEVYNALGVLVAEYHNVDSIDALETAGIYVIRITNNGNTQNCRLVVK